MGIGDRLERAAVERGGCGGDRDRIEWVEGRGWERVEGRDWKG